MKCKVCGKEFKPHQYKQITCSKECSKIWSKACKSKKMQSWIAYHKKDDYENLMDKCPNKKCRYRGKTAGLETCDFLYLTGIMRGMPVEECTRHKEVHQIIKEIPVTVRFRKE